MKREAVRGAMVCNVKVLSDKVEDVSSLEAWQAAVIREGMSEEEKALALWLMIVRFRHQNSPPYEYLTRDGHDVLPEDVGDEFCVHDAIKTANVYGYGMCCCSSSNVLSMARALGLPARGRALNGHSLPEVFYDGDWHVLDCSIVGYWRNAGGALASCDELKAQIIPWLAAHPGLRGDEALRAYARDGGWRKGPPLLASTGFFDNDGLNAEKLHGWHSMMHIYDGSVDEPYEYPYSQGYRVNVRLRKGESLTRCWSNTGLHVDLDRRLDNLTVLGCSMDDEELAYHRAYGDLAPGRIGNGTHAYDAPLAGGRDEVSPVAWENLASTADDGGSPALHVADPSRPGRLVVRMACSYVYLTAVLRLRGSIGPGGGLRVSMSRNHGVDWTAIRTVSVPGARRLRIDLTPLVRRLYDYELAFELSGQGTGLDSLRIDCDVQHSQRALPALGEGGNAITVSAEPADENTLAIEGAVLPHGIGNQLGIMEFHPELDGMECTDNGFAAARPGATATFAVECPGPMRRLRFGCHFSTHRPAAVDYLVSFDGGAGWIPACRSEAQRPGMSRYVTVGDVPAGTRAALVRFRAGDAPGVTIANVRIDADYVEPSAGFHPLKVTYLWREGEEEKSHVHVARTPRETYTIMCARKPLVRSIRVERAEEEPSA